MPEHGGPTTWSGLYFQDRVVVYHLARMLYDRALNSNDPVISVRIEAPVPVDDILVTKQSRARIFQSVKEEIRRSRRDDSAWVKMWKDIHTQIISPDFDVNRDLVEIVFPEKDSLRRSVEELTIRASNAANPTELKKDRPQDQLNVINELREILGISEEQVLNLLKTIRVRFFGDSSLLHEHLISLLSVIYPSTPEDREGLIDALVHLVFDGAERRRDFDLTAVDHWLVNRGIHVPDPLRRSFSIIGQVLGETIPFDAQQFFRGFQATWEMIRDNVPVDRTCYIKQRKSIILDEATKLDSAVKTRAYIITGSRGVGKATLARQIAFDLSRNGHLVAWLDAYPRRLHKGLVSECRLLRNQKRRIHLFAELDTPGSTRHLQSLGGFLLNDLAEFLRPFGNNTAMTLYLSVDSNHYAILRDDLEDVLGECPEVVTVPLNLDNEEIDSLIQRLHQWNALGKLQSRSHDEIKQIFQRKANKILLAALIEATNSRDETDEFNNILRREYETLPDSVQLAYPLVALSHMYQVLTPSSLFFSAVKNLPGGNIITLEQLRTSLSGVLSLQGDWIKTRHQLIARTLCESLDATESYSSEDTLWMPFFVALFKSIDESEDTHTIYVQELGTAKVVGILKTKLDTLAQNLTEGKRFANLSAFARSLVLNSIARTYQSRGDLGQALHWANNSINEVWQNDMNGAKIIIMYCYIATRNRVGALEIANQIAEHSNNPWHLLHAIRVISRWGAEPKEAMRILNTHENELRHYPSFGEIRAEVLKSSIHYEDYPRDGNPWAHTTWVHGRLALGQITPDEAIDRLLEILDREPNVHRAFADVCHLLFIEDRLDDVIALCNDVIENADSSPTEGFEPRKLAPVNPIQTQSMALCTKGWAILRREGITATREVEQLFQQSLELNPNNAWCHNWRGLFLHTTEKESGIAEQEIKTALRLYRNVPPFYRNLARVILETNVNPYSRERNQEVIKLCESGLALCPPESYWNWGGLRAELDSFLYCANSLKAQNLPERANLSGDLMIGSEYEDIE